VTLKIPINQYHQENLRIYATAGNFYLVMVS